MKASRSNERASRRWSQFSVRQMLLLTALVALAVFLFVRNTRHHRAATALENLGADIGYLGARQGWLESIFGRATIQDVTNLTCEGERFGDEHMGYVGTLESVRWLSLAESRVTNRGLAQLSDLKDLTTLNLNGTKITDASLAALANLGQLQRLDLSETNISGIGLNELKHLGKLQVLDISETSVESEGLKSLARLTGLTTISLRRNRIVDTDLEHLKPLSDLSQLDLGQTPVTDAGLKRLQTHRSLRNVDLRGTRVTRRGRHDFLQNSNARLQVDWDSYQLTIQGDEDPNLADLQWMTDLWSLTLESTNVTSKSLQHLDKLHGLHELYIDDCAIADEDLAGIKGCPRLTGLRITDAPITDHALKHFAILNELRGLVLNRTLVTGIGLAHLPPEAKSHLTELSLRGAPITPAGAREIAKLPRLLFLRLSGSAINDHGVAELRSMPRLLGLDLADTEITDESVAHLSGLSIVNVLDLSGTRLTDTGIKQLNLAKIQSLRLADLHLSDATLGWLQAEYPKCRVDRANRWRDREAQMQADTE